MLCTHVNYGFPFQQPSTSCGTYETLLVYRLATLATDQLERSLRYDLLSPECYYLYYYYYYYYYYYNATLLFIRKSVSSLLSPYIMPLSLYTAVEMIITITITTTIIKCVLFLLLYSMYKRMYIFTSRYMRDISIVKRCCYDKLMEKKRTAFMCRGRAIPMYVRLAK